MLTLLYFLSSPRIPSAHTRTARVAARHPARVTKVWSCDLEQNFGGRLNQENAGVGCQDSSAVSSDPPGKADSAGGGIPVLELSSWTSALGCSSPRFLTSLLGAHCRGVPWA